MKLVRALVFIFSLVLLAGGYAVSQMDYFHDGVASSGNSSPVVEFSALLLLLACVVFPFVGKAEEAAEK